MSETSKADAPEKSKGFWQTLPGILTGIAALITAITGLVVGILPLLNSSRTEHKPDTGAAQDSQPVNSASSRNTVPNQSHQSAAPSISSVQSGKLNLLVPENGGQLVVASSADWQQTLVGSQGYGVVGNHHPEEGVYSFRNGAPATIDSFKMLVSNLTPSTVKRFELLISNDSPDSGFHSIGKFDVRNAIAPDDPYQEFRFPPVRARYLKIRLLLNQNGSDNPFEISEFQLTGELVRP